MSRNLTKRILSLLLVLVLFVSSAPAAVFATEEETVQIEEEAMPRAVQADLEATIAQQIRAFAKSIDKSGADDDAAMALAMHGITGGGKKLNVGKDHALTATLMNSNLMIDVLTNGCTQGIQYMDKLGRDTLLVHATSGWYSSNLSSDLYFFRNKKDADAFVKLIGTKRVRTATGNAYDNSLVWMGGSVTTQTTIKRIGATADEVIYNLEVVSTDTFDFRGIDGAIREDIASILGSVFFREFRWESKVNFQIKVPNTCSHSGDFTSKVTKPTCAAQGYTTRTCSLCGYSFKTDYVNKLPHTYTTAVTPPTCAEQGYTVYTCSKCGDQYTDHFLEALGHRYGEWTVTAEPSCDEAGQRRRDCEICGDYETEVIEATGHDYTYVVTDPTCTEPGYTTGRCSCGDEIVTDHTDPLGHDMDEWSIAKAATCTKDGQKRRDCSRCDYCETETLSAVGHSYDMVVTAPTCTADGFTTHTCHCGDRYINSYVDALGHQMGQWVTVTEPNPAKAGQERRDCDRCNHFQTRSVPYEGNALKLEGKDLTGQKEVWIDGIPYPVITVGKDKYVELPNEKDCILVTYTYHNAGNADVHTQYPSGMKVYKVSKGKLTHIKELDNLLQYSGSSIRITGKKGIRMITSIDKSTRTALTGKGLAGYTLVEYGTVLAWASDLKGGKGLVLGEKYAKSNYAYKKGVADPIFKDTGKLIQYTNVLVGFSNDQCIPDIAMRPYIILKDAKGNQITLYGGVIYRSVGYIAWQNRNAFQPGSAAYDYVWKIIHHVYGNKYDKDYRG